MSLSRSHKDCICQSWCQIAIRLVLEWKLTVYLSQLQNMSKVHPGHVLVIYLDLYLDLKWAWPRNSYFPGKNCKILGKTEVEMSALVAWSVNSSSLTLATSVWDFLKSCMYSYYTYFHLLAVFSNKFNWIYFPKYKHSSLIEPIWPHQTITKDAVDVLPNTWK